MKKSLVVFTAGALLSSSVYASKARMVALGEDKDKGSFYIADDRNIFHNVAHINSYRDFAILEWGSASGQNLVTSGVTVSEMDLADGPKAQGGFYKAVGDYTFGAYLGNESDTISLLRAAADKGATSRNLKGSEDVLDLFVGGSASSFDWGVGLAYSSSSNENQLGGTGETSQHAYALRLGLAAQNWEAWANIALGNEAENEGASTRDKFEGKFGYNAGFAYTFNTWTVYADYDSIDWEQSYLAGASTLEDDGAYRKIETTVAYQREVNESLTAFARFGFYYKTALVEISDTNPTRLSNAYFPLVFALEGKATSWLTLRGSVTQRLFDQKNNRNISAFGGVAQVLAASEFGTEGKGSLGDTTDVAAGATLQFGEIKIDGLIGTTDFSRAGEDNEDGVLTTDNLLSRVALTYDF